VLERPTVRIVLDQYTSVNFSSLMLNMNNLTLSNICQQTRMNDYVQYLPCLFFFSSRCSSASTMYSLVMTTMPMITEVLQFIYLNRINTTSSQSSDTLTRQISNRIMMSMSNPAQLVDENRYLNEELNRVETILNSTRAEKDELSIRYNALSDRVSCLMFIDR
jgi:hypothetical protein